MALPLSPPNDDAAMSLLRAAAAELGDGTDWSRCSDHEVMAQLAASPTGSSGGVAPLTLYALAPKLAPAAPAAAAPAAPPPAPRSSAPVTEIAAPSVPSAFSADLDVAAMVLALTEAARDGTPFCEECERARRERQAA